MISSVTVLGIGALGGFVADSICDIEELETLIIVDEDVVETRNLRNSIYRSVDVGFNKTEALTDIIKSKKPEIEIISINKKYYEGKTIIPKSDLVLDCRDYTYDRTSEIHARLYMSSRYLIVDCRRKVVYEKAIHGRYLTELNRDDLKSAGFIIYRLITTGALQQLLNNSIVQKYELDFIQCYDKPCDIIYDENSEEKRFVNLPSKIVPILNTNKNKDLKVYLGSKNHPFAESRIPKLALRTTDDLVNNLNSLTQFNVQFNSYLISLNKDYNEAYIEIIPETGAA